MATPVDTWTVITASEVQPNKPVTATLASRWAFNLNAALQGASGAQRVYIGAWERLNTGTTQRLIDATEYETGLTTYQVARSFMMMQAGTATFAFSTRTTGTGVTARMRRVRQTGSATFGETTYTGGTYSETLVDVAVEPGDLIYTPKRTFTT